MEITLDIPHSPEIIVSEVWLHGWYLHWQWDEKYPISFSPGGSCITLNESGTRHSGLPSNLHGAGMPKYSTGLHVLDNPSLSCSTEHSRRIYVNSVYVAAERREMKKFSWREGLQATTPGLKWQHVAEAGRNERRGS